MTKLPLLAAAAAVLAASPAMAVRDTPDVQFEKAIAGRVAGTPSDCITLANITSTEIITGRAILYRVGARLYVNEPRSGADTLNADDVLVTRTFGSQLCSIDTVRLIDRGSRFPRGFVMLGKFVPYTKPKPAN